MSTAIAKNLQVGTSGTATDNFTIFQPATPDGTLRIGNGNTGITTSLVALNSSGNVGIGTSSPTQKLQIAGGNSNYIRVDDTTNSVANLFGSALGNGIIGTFSNHPLLFHTNSAERARFDTSGNLLVGTTNSGGSKFAVNGNVQQSGTLGRITQAVQGIGATVSTITVDVGGGIDATSYFVEIDISGFSGVFLKYAHAVYKASSWSDFGPNVVQNLASAGVSVAYTSPSSGVLRYTISVSGTTTFPVVSVKVNSGGTTSNPLTTISIS